jgi:lysyl-tRNA synthetase class 2
VATLKELRDSRLEKLNKLKELGINPFPSKSYRNTELKNVVKKFEEFEGKEVIVAGRITSVRSHGELWFIDIKDESGKVQLYIKSDTLAKADSSKEEIAFEHLHLLDQGDFIEGKGVVTKTKRGEISVEVSSIRLLTKTIRPIPEELNDKEVRLRRRYLDTNINPDVHERYIRRSRFWQSVRQFLLNEGFVEISIPILENTAGGADANPFVTHMDALDQDFYLRISHELPLKRLLGGGYEKVFDIGLRFRNEGYSDEHLPEHMATEWYWAYADWNQGMELTQRFIRYIADQTWGKRKFTLLNGAEIDLGEDNIDWPRISFVDVLKENYGIDPLDTTLEQVKEQLKKHEIKIEKSENLSRGIDKLWKKIRVTLPGPAFLINIPTFLQPLAKLQANDGRLTEQFNLILGGTEACKAYSELNDPLDQLGRFMEQEELRQAGDSEAQMLDIDFVEMLEYGMPPACGYGHSERVFWMLEGVTAREGVPFPQLRHEIDDVTKGIYPEIFSNKKVNPENALEPLKTQDFSKKIVIVVNKDLEKWQIMNSVGHISAYLGNKLRENFGTGDNFVTKDSLNHPRNSQYPIIVLGANSNEQLHNLMTKIREAGLEYHGFIKEMIETSDDSKITEILSNKDDKDIEYLGIGMFGSNEKIDALTKKFSLLK